MTSLGSVRRLQLPGQAGARAGRNLWGRARSWKGMRAVNGTSQAGEEGFAGCTAGHVPFQFRAQRPIKIPVQILGKIGKDLLTFPEAWECRA